MQNAFSTEANEFTLYNVYLLSKAGDHFNCIHQLEALPYEQWWSQQLMIGQSKEVMLAKLNGTATKLLTPLMFGAR